MQKVCIHLNAMKIKNKKDTSFQQKIEKIEIERILVFFYFIILDILMGISIVYFMLGRRGDKNIFLNR